MRSQPIKLQLPSRRARCSARIVCYIVVLHTPTHTEAYNWCTVPYSGADVLVVAGIAVVVACLLHGKWSMLLTLIVGASFHIRIPLVQRTPFFYHG